jgi:hypothetical protein
MGGLLSLVSRQLLGAAERRWLLVGRVRVRGRHLWDGGPERLRFSDPDASWGHRSAVGTRKGGGFYGYRLHLVVCTTTRTPLAWTVETAKANETKFALSLIDEILDRGFRPLTAAMDKAYDVPRIYDAARSGVAVPSSPCEKRSQ